MKKSARGSQRESGPFNFAVVSDEVFLAVSVGSTVPTPFTFLCSSDQSRKFFMFSFPFCLMDLVFLKEGGENGAWACLERGEISALEFGRRFRFVCS